MHIATLQSIPKGPCAKIIYLGLQIGYAQLTDLLGGHWLTYIKTSNTLPDKYNYFFLLAMVSFSLYLMA